MPLDINRFGFWLRVVRFFPCPVLFISWNLRGKWRHLRTLNGDCSWCPQLRNSEEEIKEYKTSDRLGRIKFTYVVFQKRGSDSFMHKSRRNGFYKFSDTFIEVMPSLVLLRMVCIMFVFDFKLYIKHIGQSNLH